MTLYRTCFKLLLTKFKRICFAHQIKSVTMDYVKMQVRSFEIYCMRYPTHAYKLALATNWHRNPVLSLLFFPLFVRKGKILVTSTSVEAILQILSDETFFTQADRENVTVASFRRLDVNEDQNNRLVESFLRLLPKLRVVSLNFLVKDRVLRAVATFCPELIVLDCRLRRSSESQQPHSPFDDALGSGNSGVLYFPPYDPTINDVLVIRDLPFTLPAFANTSHYISKAYSQFQVDIRYFRIHIRKFPDNFLKTLRLTVGGVLVPLYIETFHQAVSKPSANLSRYGRLRRVFVRQFEMRHRRRDDVIPLPVAVTISSLQLLWDLPNITKIFFNDLRRNDNESCHVGFSETDVRKLLENLPRLERLEYNQHLLSAALKTDTTRIHSNLSSISLPNRDALLSAHKNCPKVTQVSILKWENISTDTEEQPSSDTNSGNEPSTDSSTEMFPHLSRLRIDWMEGPITSIAFERVIGKILSSLELTKETFTKEDVETLGFICPNIKLLSLQDYYNEQHEFLILADRSLPNYEKDSKDTLFPNIRVFYCKLADPRGLSLFLHKKSKLQSLFLDFVNLKAFCQLMEFMFNQFEASTCLPSLEILYITPKFVCTATLLKRLISLFPKLSYLHSEVKDLKDVENFIFRENLRVELVNIFDEFRSESVHFDCRFF